jgi:aspartyl-tRNA(Asn)/glutamyl-tRNA(Gln) amidotransferase subunit C
MTNHNVEKLSKLTNLKIAQESFESFKQSVDNILDWCESLNAIDTSNVEPMFSPMDIMNKHLENLREDVVVDGNIQKEVLSNCKDVEDVFICVPKVIE